MYYFTPILMKSIELYRKICSYDNLLIAFKKARKGKTTKDYVIKFEKHLEEHVAHRRRAKNV